jgi:glutamate 5-kinase
MDLTAITLCMERKIPVVVFNLKTNGNIARVLKGEDVGTRILPSNDGQLAETAFAQPTGNAAPAKSPKARK